MALPFTIDQFCGVFRDDNVTVWPMQWILVALASVAIVAGAVGVALLFALGRPLRIRTS